MAGPGINFTLVLGGGGGAMSSSISAASPPDQEVVEVSSGQWIFASEVEEVWMLGLVCVYICISKYIYIYTCY